MVERKVIKRVAAVSFAILIVTSALACSLASLLGRGEPESTPTPTKTLKPTSTATATGSPMPAETPVPTELAPTEPASPQPSPTHPAPTEPPQTPLPTHTTIHTPTHTQTPTLTSTPTDTPTATTPPAAELLVINESRVEVCELYTRVVGETEWGENLLGRGESISDGESRLWQVAPGDYDLLAKDCAGNQLSAEQDVPIRESYDWVIPLAVQPGGAQLTVHNLCGGPIFGLYCTDCEGLSAVNLIEGDPIDRGESRTLSIPEEGFRVFEARDADDLWLDFWVILLEEGETATWDVCSL